MHLLWRSNSAEIQGLCYMKAKGPVERWSRQTGGPQQKCNLGFRCIDTPDNGLREKLWS